MKTSAILQEARERISSPDSYVKNRLAVNSMGGKVHPSAEGDVTAFNSVGSLLRTLGNHPEETTVRALRSATQRLFAGDSYTFLTEAANNLGFKTISDLDEFGTKSQRDQMWDNAIQNALITEDLRDLSGNRSL